MFKYFENPVIADDGFTYELEIIQRHFKGTSSAVVTDPTFLTPPLAECHF